MSTTTSHPLESSTGHGRNMASTSSAMTRPAQTPGTSQLSTTSAAKRSATIPSDVVRLDVLLTSGQRKFFDFSPSTSIRNVRETIWSDWPQDWPSRPASSSAIRILHLGHILDDKAVLSPAATSTSSATATAARIMPTGRTTVVHLLVRQPPARKGSGDDDEPLKKRKQRSETEAGCCGCTIA